jgi:hypothetical protein
MGTVLMVAGLTTVLWVSRSALHQPVPWLVAIGAGLGALLLCVVLLASRSLSWPFAIDVLVALGLGVGVLFSLLEVTRLGGFWLWVLFGLEVLAFGLIYSLGDYPD